MGVRTPPDISKMPTEAHATTSGYVYWRCRCVRCRVFWTGYRAGRRKLGLDVLIPRPLSLSIRVRGLPGTAEWDDPTFDAVCARMRVESEWSEFLAACADLEATG